ncbi:MAG: PIN domain-containing protein, partial [Planctomycetota bacterium]
MIDQGPVALAEPTVAPRTGTTHADDATKTFVLDTNVILHDSACLRQFAEHDVAIPITVLEELDRFKKGSEDKHFHARQFLREVDALTGDALALPDARPPAPDDLDPAYESPPVDASPPDGVPLGPGLGRLRVVFGGEFRKKLAAFFTEQTPDHRILEAALTLRERSPGPVILVTKDTNLRMKAKAFGLVAQDYENDKIADADVLYTGKRLVEGLDRDFISKFYSDETRQRVSVEEFADACDAAVPEAPFEPPVPHENFILKN